MDDAPKCPFHHGDGTEIKMRPELREVPPRMKSLPLDNRGYPVPWFVAWHNGEPEFRAMDPVKWKRAVRERLCWVCGEILGTHLAFVIGPMCGINRVAAEPPMHRDCALWSIENCPFLNQRQGKRRRQDDDLLSSSREAPGVMLERQPGAVLLWVTRSYRVFPVERGHLIEIGNPERVEFYSHGRPATRAEVVQSVESGIHLLEYAAREGGPEDEADLAAAKAELVAMYPPEAMKAVPDGPH